MEFPIIAEAYPIGETKSVPVDRIELKHKYDNKVLVLGIGDYRIVMTTREDTYEYNLEINLIP